MIPDKLRPKYWSEGEGYLWQKWVGQEIRLDCLKNLKSNGIWKLVEITDCGTHELSVHSLCFSDYDDESQVIWDIVNGWRYKINPERYGKPAFDSSKWTGR